MMNVKKYCKYLVFLITCSFISYAVLLFTFSDPKESKGTIPYECEPRVRELHAKRDTNTPNYMELPIKIWDASFYHRGEALHILFIGPRGTREWMGNNGDKATDEIMSSYQFICSFPTTNTTSVGSFVKDPHHNQFLISCPVSLEEVLLLDNKNENENNDENNNSNNNDNDDDDDIHKRVKVILHDVTHEGESEVIDVCQLPLKKFEVTACTMVKNEAHRLPEWIEYLLLVGVEHIILYDHNSSDDLVEKLKPYKDKNLVTIVPWPFDYNKYQAQTVQLNSCIYKFRDFNEWQLQIDVDEFPYSPRGSIVQYLRDMHASNPEMGSVQMNQYLFGTNSKLLEEGNLQIESSIYRASKPRNAYPKQAFYVPLMNTVSVHIGTSGGNTIDADINELVMYHYWHGERGNNPEINAEKDTSMRDQFAERIKEKLRERYNLDINQTIPA